MDRCDLCLTELREKYFLGDVLIVCETCFKDEPETN